MAEKKAAIIDISKALANISLATLAAIAGASGNWEMSGIATAGFTTLGMLDPLISRLKGEKKASLEIPIPDWWSDSGETWQSICSTTAEQFSSILDDTITQLRQGQSIPTQETVRQILIKQIAKQIPIWDVRQNKELAAIAIAQPFLEKVADILRYRASEVQDDKIAQTLNEILLIVRTLKQPAEKGQATEAASSMQTLTTTSTGKNILIASLGDSPVVVSAMYDLLTQQEGIEIDKVYVLYPEGDSVKRAYKLVRDALKDLADADRLEPVRLGFEDANSRRSACRFLSILYQQINDLEKRGHKVYLSLAGGRKSMAALMAWIAPFFSCIEKLYHVVDQDETHFYSIEDLEEMPESLQQEVMHPRPLKQLDLVDIPFDRDRQMKQKLREKLRLATDDELERLQDEDLDTAIFSQIVTQKDKDLDVWLTRHTQEQFEALRATDVDLAREVWQCFESIALASYLRQALLPLEVDSYKKFLLRKAEQIARHKAVKISLTFYTKPEDIYTTSTDDNVEKIVICDLYTETEQDQRKLKEISSSPGFSIHPQYNIEDILPPPVPTESALIVPLGKFPMVATQLYTLLAEQECRSICEVILVIPNNGDLINSADIAQRVLQQEKRVQCRCIYVKDIKDIASKKDCKLYQETLEGVIEQAKARHRGREIDLALSGGRKGMTAMTIFAAQKKNIKFVYHTLIKNEQLYDEIERETTVDKLTDLRLSREELCNRLFLRKYVGNDLYSTEFLLFKVPVFNAADE